jgi:hypothetical protein
MHTVDHVQAEPELGVQKEQVSEVSESPQATSCMDTNLALDKDKPRCIPPIILSFSFNHYLHVKFDCSLGLEELSDTLNALWLPSRLPLITLLEILRC